MVKADLRPGGRDVAVFAHIIRRDMVLRLASGRPAIMAGNAGARDIGMVEADLRPGGRDVAVLAGIIRRDVIL